MPNKATNTTLRAPAYTVSLDHRLRQHSDFQKLLADGDFFWRRMMGSVARPSTLSGEVAMLRGASDDTHREVSRLRAEIDRLSRVVAGDGR